MNTHTMAMLLPKGIVYNNPRIYNEIASYPVIPRERIWHYWHGIMTAAWLLWLHHANQVSVYTTTFGKLKDPTANRLENFWWHVFGSDRSQLSGPTLARIFEQISDGSTFVPLRGPPNRYEGPSIPAILKQAQSGNENDNAPGSPGAANGKAPKTEPPKDLAPSSTRPPPAHPILKKPRGPSSSGPRPTARFVSLAGSDVEDEDEETEVDSLTSGTANGSSQARPTTSSTAKEKPRKQIGGISTKKIMAFSNKRRPAMRRRQNSQSSATGSEAGSREERSSPSTRISGSLPSVPPIAEGPDHGDDSPRLSEKSTRKRVAVLEVSLTTRPGPLRPKDMDKKDAKPREAKEMEVSGEATRSLQQSTPRPTSSHTEKASAA